MGLLSGIVKGVFGSIAAKKNKKAAQQFTDATKWQDTPITMPGMNLGFDAQGNPIGQVTDPTNQNMAQSLYGFGGDMLGQYAQGQNQLGMASVNQNAINPYLINTQLPGFLTSQYGQTQRALNNLPGLGSINPALANYTSMSQAVNPALSGYQSQTGNIMGQLGQVGQNLDSIAGSMPSQYGTQMGNQFSGQATNMLGQLGSFNPNQLASDYANNLRAQAAPGEQNAANNLAQSLFNTGRLGSTGGAQLMGELGKSLANADIGRTIAGQQLAGQEQSRLAGLAQNFGQLGEGINLNAFNANLQGAQAAGGLQGMLAGILGQQGGLDQQAYGQAFQTNQAGFDRGTQLNQSDYERLMQNNQLGYDRSVQLQGLGYNQGLNTTQQRFMNAMQLFGGVQGQNSAALQQQQNLMQNENLGLNAYQANTANQGQQLQGALQSLGLGQQFGQQDLQNLMQLLQLSNQTSHAQSGVNLQAYNPTMQASVAKNNANASLGSGIVSSIGKFFGL